MSYRWRQETTPITSLLILQRALDQCGFEIVEPSHLMQQLSLARQSIKNAKNNEEKIVAYDELVHLIKECNKNNSLPQSIKLDGFELELNKSFRYVATGYSSNYDETQDQSALSSISKLNKIYQSIALKLDNELKDAMSSSNDLKLQEALIRAVKAEQKSYKKSVKDAKDKIFLTIKENAKKEGYTVKRNVFNKGSNAGREQYVVVKRS